MFRTFRINGRTAGRSPARNLASTFAMAIALGGAGLVANAGLAAPAHAAAEYSDAFVALYQPVADVVNAEGGDIASVSGQFPAVIAAATTPDDKFAAGNLILIAGNNANNPAWQRQGLELQLASGKVAPENIAQFNWFVGNLAYGAEDYMAARTALMAADAAGWTQTDPTGLIAETYYMQDDIAGGVAFVKSKIQQRLAAGAEIPAQWLIRGLVVANQSGDIGLATDMSELLVLHQTSPTNWKNGLQVVNALGDYDDQGRLDLLRLMRLTGALSARTEYVRYIETADPRIMSNELTGVLTEAVAAGLISNTETYYREVNEIIQDRMSEDRSDAPSLVADARAASATARDAMDAGNVLYSLDDFAGAEEMFALAASRGGADLNAALTREGMSQVRQDKYADALATLAQVSGDRAPVARMWAAYAAVQQRGG